MKKSRILFVILAITISSMALIVYGMISTGGNPLITDGGILVDFHNDPIETDPHEGGADEYYDCNIDIENLGPDAYDLAVLMDGNHDTPDSYIYIGNPHNWPNPGYFDNTSIIYDSVQNTTTLHWQGFKDVNSNDIIINTNQIIHIGWGYPGAEALVKDMWWTDKVGNRVPGSVVHVINGKTYRISGGIIGINWRHDFNIDTAITIQDVNYAVLTDLIPLPNLNGQNVELAGALHPLHGGESLTVLPGKTVTLTIPEYVQPNAVVVLRYRVTGSGSMANVVNFIQHNVK